MLLKFLRKRKNMKRIMWGLAIIIIPAFVIWGTGRSGTKSGPKYAGEIFNKKISLDEYVDMWRVTRDNAVRSFGTNVPTELIDVMTWNRILLLEAAKRENIKVEDIEVVEKIQTFPIFQRGGTFDKKLYKSMLDEGARGFEERVRDDLLITKLQEKKVADVTVTSEEGREEYKKKFEKIKASFVSIPFSNFEKEVPYEEITLLDFFNKNKIHFRKPEQVNVRYIEIPLSQYDEEFAYKVLDYTKDKRDLKAATKQFSLVVKETGLFSMQDEVPGIGWSYEFTKYSFQLKPNQISDTLVKNNEVFYILQLKEKKESYMPNFSEVTGLVKNAYIKDASIKLARKKAGKFSLSINRGIKMGEGFGDVANSFGLDVTPSDFLARDDYLPGLGPVREFVETASSLKPSQISPPIKMLNSWVILRLDEYQDIDERKFEEEKESFRKNLLSIKKQQYFEKWFEDFKRKARFVSYLKE